MPYGSRGMRGMARKVGIKHIITGSALLEAGATVRNITIAVGVQDALPTTNPTNVEAGHGIRAIYADINMNVEGSLTTNNNWYIVKLKLGQTIPIPGAEGTSAVRNQILKSGMEMMPGINHGPSRQRIGWIKIPPRMQRLAENEYFMFAYYVAAAGNVADTCWKFIYKDEN